MTLREAALAYARHGLAVFPLQPRAKRPVTGSHGVHDASRDEAVIEKWWADEPNANIGIACGRPSGVVVFDVDGEVGEESLKALNLALPLTPAVSTGRGVHMYFRLPDEALGNRAGMSPGLDFRADGGYVVAPPSVHPDGHLYEWAVDYTVPFAAIPAEILEMARQSVSVSQTLEGPIPKGKRNDTAFRQASAMRRLGMDEEAIFTALRADKRYDPPLSDFELSRIAKNAARYEPDSTIEANEAFQARMAAKATAKESEPAAPARQQAKFNKVQRREAREVGVRLEDVLPAQTKWIWRPYLPLGKLVILDGDPGLGKSTLLLDLAARITRDGVMPGTAAGDLDMGGHPVGIISVEDSLAETVKPRLVAQRARQDRVIVVDDDSDMILPDDMSTLERLIKDNGLKFVVIDPLMAMINSSIDSHRDQEIRTEIMRPLKIIAEEQDCTIALIRHLNKLNGGAAIYRGGGSIGITGATRSAMLVGKDPADPGNSRVFAHVKCNLARSGDSWRYVIDDGDAVGVLRWVETTDVTADQLVNQDFRESPKKAEAAKFLRDMLVNGPMQQAELFKYAADDGIKEGALREAAKMIGVENWKDGFKGPSVWGFKEQREEQEVDL